MVYKHVTHNLKKVIFIPFIVILTLIGCIKKKQTVIESKHPIIEIYTPKERIPSIDGIELPSNWNLAGLSEHKAEFYRKYARLDTISQKLIFAGRFVAKVSDLPNSPLIQDKDIVGFDFEYNTLKLSESGVKKLLTVLPNMNFSRQIIITADKKPILNGYLFSTFSSSYVSHFYIKYNRDSSEPDLTWLNNEQDYEIYYNPNFEYDYNLKKYDFSQRIQT